MKNQKLISDVAKRLQILRQRIDRGEVDLSEVAWHISRILDGISEGQV